MSSSSVSHVTDSAMSSLSPTPGSRLLSIVESAVEESDERLKRFLGVGVLDGVLSEEEGDPELNEGGKGNPEPGEKEGIPELSGGEQRTTAGHDTTPTRPVSHPSSSSQSHLAVKDRAVGKSISQSSEGPNVETLSASSKSSFPQNTLQPKVTPTKSSSKTHLRRVISSDSEDDIPPAATGVRVSRALQSDSEDSEGESLSASGEGNKTRVLYSSGGSDGALSGNDGASNESGQTTPGRHPTSTDARALDRAKTSALNKADATGSHDSSSDDDAAERFDVPLTRAQLMETRRAMSAEASAAAELTDDEPGHPLESALATIQNAKIDDDFVVGDDAYAADVKRERARESARERRISKKEQVQMDKEQANLRRKQAVQLPQRVARVSVSVAELARQVELKPLSKLRPYSPVVKPRAGFREGSPILSVEEGGGSDKHESKNQDRGSTSNNKGTNSALHILAPNSTQKPQLKIIRRGLDEPAMQGDDMLTLSDDEEEAGQPRKRVLSLAPRSSARPKSLAPLPDRYDSSDDDLEIIGGPETTPRRDTPRKKLDVVAPATPFQKKLEKMTGHRRTASRDNMASDSQIVSAAKSFGRDLGEASKLPSPGKARSAKAVDQDALNARLLANIHRQNIARRTDKMKKYKHLSKAGVDTSTKVVAQDADSVLDQIKHKNEIDRLVVDLDDESGGEGVDGDYSDHSEPLDFSGSEEGGEVESGEEGGDESVEGDESGDERAEDESEMPAASPGTRSPSTGPPRPHETVGKAADSETVQNAETRSESHRESLPGHPTPSDIFKRPASTHTLAPSVFKLPAFNTESPSGSPGGFSQFFNDDFSQDVMGPERDTSPTQIEATLAPHLRLSTQEREKDAALIERMHVFHADPLAPEPDRPVYINQQGHLTQTRPADMFDVFSQDLSAEEAGENSPERPNPGERSQWPSHSPEKSPSTERNEPNLTQSPGPSLSQSPSKGRHAGRGLLRETGAASPGVFLPSSNAPDEGSPLSFSSVAVTPTQRATPYDPSRSAWEDVFGNGYGRGDGEGQEEGGAASHIDASEIVRDPTRAAPEELRTTKVRRIAVSDEEDESDPEDPEGMEGSEGDDEGEELGESEEKQEQNASTAASNLQDGHDDILESDASAAEADSDGEGDVEVDSDDESLGDPLDDAQLGPASSPRVPPLLNAFDVLADAGKPLPEKHDHTLANAFIEREANLSEDEEGGLGGVSADEDERGLDEELEEIMDNKTLSAEEAAERRKAVLEKYGLEEAEREAAALKRAQEIADGTERRRRKNGGVDLDDDDFDDDAVLGLGAARKPRAAVIDMNLADLHADEATKAFADVMLRPNAETDDMAFLNAPIDDASDDDEDHVINLEALVSREVEHSATLPSSPLSSPRKVFEITRKTTTVLTTSQDDEVGDSQFYLSAADSQVFVRNASDSQKFDDSKGSHSGAMSAVTTFNNTSSSNNTANTKKRQSSSQPTPSKTHIKKPKLIARARSGIMSIIRKGEAKKL